MSDCFALFDEPRRPWLDAERLKEKFHALTTAHHPDVNPAGGTRDFSELNAAYQTLADPARRLRHLRQLERGETVGRDPQPPPGLIDLFLRIGTLRGALDRFEASEARAATPLQRALLSGEKSRLSEQLTTCVEDVERERAAALRELRALDECWQRGERDFASLETLQGRLVYLGKWAAQLAEEQFRFGDLNPSS